MIGLDCCIKCVFFFKLLLFRLALYVVACWDMELLSISFFVVELLLSARERHFYFSSQHAINHHHHHYHRAAFGLPARQSCRRRFGGLEQRGRPPISKDHNILYRGRTIANHNPTTIQTESVGSVEAMCNVVPFFCWKRGMLNFHFVRSGGRESLQTTSSDTWDQYIFTTKFPFRIVETRTKEPITFFISTVRLGKFYSVSDDFSCGWQQKSRWFAQKLPELPSTSSSTTQHTTPIIVTTHNFTHRPPNLVSALNNNNNIYNNRNSQS
jgi:hypothetical protein